MKRLLTGVLLLGNVSVFGSCPIHSLEVRSFLKVNQVVSFDEDFDVYFGGAIQKKTSAGAIGAWGTPWGQLSVLDILNK